MFCKEFLLFIYVLGVSIMKIMGYLRILLEFNFNWNYIFFVKMVFEDNFLNFGLLWNSFVIRIGWKFFVVWEVMIDVVLCFVWVM